MKPKEKENKLDKLSEILPDGLSESTINEISKIINEFIKTEIKTRMALLESKVNSFLRLKVDELKIIAEKELALENKEVANAEILSTLRTLLVTESQGDFIDTALQSIKEQNRESNVEVEVLTENISKLLEDNEFLLNKLQLLEDRLDKSKRINKKLKRKLTESVSDEDADEDNDNLNGTAKMQAKNLNTVFSEDKDSTDTKVILSEKTNSNKTKYGNELISEEMIKLAGLPG